MDLPTIPAREQSSITEYQDVVPSTDLPPSIKGKPQCYLSVVVGKLTWRSCAYSSYKLPLPSTTYIRLRWWGESSNGTYFRPHCEKYGRIIKCRAQFCVRSNPFQIATYFKDIGSACFDVLCSPNSIPLGRVLVPAVVSLSFNCSIRGSFPVRTQSANIIGHLQIQMTFKPRKCDCDELNFEAVGTNKDLCCRPCPKRYSCNMDNPISPCDVNNKLSTYNKGTLGYPCEGASTIGKGSCCYAKVAASGRYGRKRCVCNKMYACTCGYGDTYQEPNTRCAFRPPPDQMDCESTSQACPLREAQMEDCPYIKQGAQVSNRMEELNCLIEKTKKLNKQLMTALQKDRVDKSELHQDNRSMQKDLCKFKNVNLARISVYALYLNASGKCGRKAETLRPCACCPQTKCSMESLDTGRIYIVEYKFPATLTACCYSETTQVVSPCTTEDHGCIRFDQNSSFDVLFNSITSPLWLAESLNFLVLKKDFRTNEVLSVRFSIGASDNFALHQQVSVIGSGELPLAPAVDHPQLFHSRCIPIMPVDNQAASACATLQVSVELISGNSNGPQRSVSQPNCLFAKAQKSKKCKLENFDDDTSHRCKLMMNSCKLRTGCFEEDVDCPHLSWSFLYLYIFLEKAKNIPAARIRGDVGCYKCFTPNVYLVCRALPKDDPSNTPTVWNDHNPCFCFAEIIPVKINGEMLKHFKCNSVVVEVWTKVPDASKSSDKLLGLVKIALKPFYQALNNQDAARISLDSNCPLVAVDDYRPIIDVMSSHERGTLKLAIALGTQVQINTFRRCREDNDSVPDGCGKTEPDSCCDTDFTRIVCDAGETRTCCSDVDLRSDTSNKLQSNAPPVTSTAFAGQHVEHVIKITIDGLEEFKPCKAQLSGDSKCFLQYKFPTQNCFDDWKTSGVVPDNCCLSESTTVQAFSTPPAACINNLQFNHTNMHRFLLPSSLSLHDFLLKSQSNSCDSDISFQVCWSSSCRKVNNKLLAKGCLSTQQLASIFAISDGECAVKRFLVPLRFVKSCDKPAGNVNMSVKYKRNMVKKKKELRSFDDVRLQFTLLRANLSNQLASTNGSARIDSYATIKTTFLPDPKTYNTEVFKSTLNPEYNHRVELCCPAHFAGDDEDTPRSLAEKLAEGYIHIEIKSTSLQSDDVVLGEAKVPTKYLLIKTEGYKEWCHLTSPSKAGAKVGTVQVSLSFTSDDAIETVLQAAKEVNWTPSSSSNLRSLVYVDAFGNLKPVDKLSSPDGFVTIRVSATSAWLPKRLIAPAQSSHVAGKSYVYLRYKFHDFDTFTSKPHSVSDKCCKRIDREICGHNFGHRKAYLCRPNQGLVCCLREKGLEIQVWQTKNCSRKKKAPEGDQLIGSTQIDASPLLAGGERHVCGLFPLFREESDDLLDASLQVCLSLTPGNDVKSYEVDGSDDEAIADDEDEENIRKDTFKAMVTVERALYLALLPPTTMPNLQKTPKARCYVSFPLVADGGLVEKTKFVDGCPCPVWNDAREVDLDRRILDQERGKMFFRIWQHDSIKSCDRMVGLAKVDLSVLRMGFPAVTGWYNVLDVFGNCSGEIKLAITPTEPKQLFDEGTAMSFGSYREEVFSSVPLLGPIVTPLGGFYYPNLTGSTLDGSSVMSLSHLAPDFVDSAQNARMHSKLLQQINELESVRSCLRQKLATHSSLAINPPPSEEPTPEIVNNPPSPAMADDPSVGSIEDETNDESSNVNEDSSAEALVPSGCPGVSNDFAPIFAELNTRQARDTTANQSSPSNTLCVGDHSSVVFDSDFTGASSALAFNSVHFQEACFSSVGAFRIQSSRANTSGGTKSTYRVETRLAVNSVTNQGRPLTEDEKVEKSKDDVSSDLPCCSKCDRKENKSLKRLQKDDRDLE